MRLKSTGMGYFLAIPDAISLMNLVFGFLAILMVIDNHLTIASLCILVALVFDSIDGWVARRVGREDKFGFGKNMDSLADIVSFGAAPAAILYALGTGMSGWISYLVAIVCLFVLICGILRLARYNVIADRINYKGFIGLPIPATAVILVSYYLSGLFNLTIAAILMILCGYLMISTIRFPKFDNVYLIAIGAIMIIILISPLNIYLYGVNLPALVIFIFALVYMFKIFLEFFIDTETPIVDRNQASKRVDRAKELTGNGFNNLLENSKNRFKSIRDNINQASLSDFTKEDKDANNVNVFSSGNDLSDNYYNEQAIRSVKASYPTRSVKSEEKAEAEISKENVGEVSPKVEKEADVESKVVEANAEGESVEDSESEVAEVEEESIKESESDVTEANAEVEEESIKESEVAEVEDEAVEDSEVKTSSPDGVRLN